MLTDIKLRNLKPCAKLYRKADTAGLCIEVRPTGSKLWRYRYRFDGKASMLSLGEYPAVSLAKARELRAAARKRLDAGENPVIARRTEKHAKLTAARNTFESIAIEWIEKQEGQWTLHHALDVQRSLVKEAFPAIGGRPISEIEPPEILSCLKAIEQRGALEVAHRTAQRIAAVFRYAVLTGRAKYNPAADLRGAIATRKVKHMTALPRDEVPAFLDKLENYDGQPETALALRLLVLTFVRTGELIGARWEEIEFDKAEWRIPAERMKMREAHVVPLSTQSIEALRTLHQITGESPLLFPSRSNAHKPMSNNTMLFALYRMGYHSRATGHGFRALASTTLNEQGWPPDVIERQLAHAERNKVRAAYNRAQYLPERRKMMQAWADHLDALRHGDNVIPINRKRV
jgi:integrase